MSTTVKAGWLKDSQGNKFAPKTMSSQVIRDDGTLLEEKINLDLSELRQDINEELAKKADKEHSHNDIYYTENEVDTKLSDVNTSISNIISGSTIVAKSIEATEATHAIIADTATNATSATKATQDANGNVISDVYETKENAQLRYDTLSENKSTVQFITWEVDD